MESIKELFLSGRQYREHLIQQGYKDLGWMNGWDNATHIIWDKQQALEGNVDHTQWNRSGSDCTYVLHKNKVFCSVDMGD